MYTSWFFTNESSPNVGLRCFRAGFGLVEESSRLLPRGGGRGCVLSGRSWTPSDFDRPLFAKVLLLGRALLLDASLMGGMGDFGLERACVGRFCPGRVWPGVGGSGWFTALLKGKACDHPTMMNK